METSTQPVESSPQQDVAAMPGAAMLKSRDLFGYAKSVKIEHDGKIYELRLTRLNKLILTA
ncbi:hemin uptake protein HemP [Massilia cavernae]|uniref:Hemin uptake protein HemP n=1 Tax=Massilia cavernae TaxID=2320864 RepID=A0A418Y692_9BURK|nr:hemin uptake protein HemP [Massilia cavernae]